MIKPIELTQQQRDSIIKVIKDIGSLTMQFGEGNLNMPKVIESAKKDLDNHTQNFLICTSLAYLEMEILEHIAKTGGTSDENLQ